MGTKTRFEEEAKGNSEMAYWRFAVNCVFALFDVSMTTTFLHVDQTKFRSFT